MDKIDLKKALRDCYTATKEVKLVDVPEVAYICFRGKGDPNTSQEFQDAMGVLYGLAYTIKFMCKETGRDFTVMPLEGQWWTDIPEEFRESAKEQWNWKVMIAVPDFVDKGIFEEGRGRLKAKKDPPGLERATFEVITDGLSAQFLYFGPYSGEGPYIAAMHRRIDELGCRLKGKHREIYLGNPRRTEPEKLKTIIRQPVERQ